MASQFNQLTSSKLAVTRTSLAPIVDSYDSEPIYDDVIELSQRFPSSVAKQSFVTEQGNATVYGNIVLTKESTLKCLPPPVAAKPKSPMAERRNTLPSTTGPKQHVSPVKERSNTLNNNVICSEGFRAKHLQKVPPPVAAKPKSPLMGRKSSSLYNENIANATEPSTSPAPIKQTLFNAPVHNESISATQATTQSFMDKQEIPLYGNTGTAAVSPVPSLTQKYAQPNQQISPLIERRGNPLYNTNVSNVTEPSESAATRQTLSNTPLHNETVSTKAIAQFFMDKKEIPLYGNTGTVSPVPSPTQKSARPNQQTSPFMERRSRPNDNIVTVTEQSTSPVATAFVQRTPPVPPMRIDSVPTIQATTNTARSFAEKKSYGNNSAESSRPGIVTSPTQKSAPSQSPDSNLYYGTNLHDGEHPPHSIKLQHLYDYDYVDCTPNSPTLSQDQNKAYLRSLSQADVLRLLDKMNLSQHKASFQEEQVNGAVLAILTGDDLKEIGVTKGVQLKRLLQLIAGTMSAKDLLEN